MDEAECPTLLGATTVYFFAIECKAGKGTTTALQDKNIKEIEKAGGRVIVVNENNLEEVRLMLSEMNG
jgi:flagellar biosynthesis/type III secretory pathway M-ring protein FliF/YscJ